MNTIKPAKAIVDGFRSSSLGRALLPMGTAMGLPLPYISNERPYMMLPILERGTTDSTKDETRLPIKKPVGEVRFDLLSGRLVKFQIYTCDDPLPEVSDSAIYAWFPPRAVLTEKWTQDEYQQQMDLLYGQLNEATSALLTNESNSKALKQFLGQFKRLLPSGLERYYPRVLGSASILHSARANEDRVSPRTTPFDQPGS